MAGNPLDAPHINAQIAADATYFHDQIYLWAKERYAVWSTNAGNDAQLTNAGVTAPADQTQILSLEIDLLNLIAFCENTLTVSSGSGRNVVQDCCLLRGVN